MTKTEHIDALLGAEPRPIPTGRPKHIARETGATISLVYQRIRALGLQRKQSRTARALALLEREYPDRVIPWGDERIKQIARDLELARSTINEIAVRAGFTRTRIPPVHGTVYRYRDGCRCDECSERMREKWKADYARVNQ